MPKPKRTWQEKLEDAKDLPRVCKVEGRHRKTWGSGTFVIPAPIHVDALMKKVPKGKLTTIADLQAALAKQFKTDFTCPITTGIFAWIAAHAAEETCGKNPYWRTLKRGGELNPKYPGGIETLKRKLKAEGHSVIQKGKRFFVEGFDKRLAKLSAR
jgi:hypothetical protein